MLLRLKQSFLVVVVLTQFGATESAWAAQLDSARDQLAGAAGEGWSFLTEVKDNVAASTTAAVESSIIELQNSAFAFLQLSDAMITQLKMMAWNFFTIGFLLIASSYLPVDATLALVIITIFFGSFLVSTVVWAFGTLLWLATWAPNVFLTFFAAALFSRSKSGRAWLRTRGIDPKALSSVPGLSYCMAALSEIYARVKPTFKSVYEKLDDIEEAIGWEWAPDRSVEDRLDAIEGMLAKVLQAQGQGSMTA